MGWWEPDVGLVSGSVGVDIVRRRGGESEGGEEGVEVGEEGVAEASADVADCFVSLSR
jgi:hypothetical protein